MSKIEGMNVAKITVIDNTQPMESPLKHGAFVNKNETQLMQRTDSIFLEGEDMTMNVGYVCSCTLPVFELSGSDQEFGCTHCDSVCLVEGCQYCEVLMSVDYGTGEEEVDL